METRKRTTIDGAISIYSFLYLGGKLLAGEHESALAQASIFMRWMADLWNAPLFFYFLFPLPSSPLMCVYTWVLTHFV
jgi:hypothetical protein